MIHQAIMVRNEPDGRFFYTWIVTQENASQVVKIDKDYFDQLTPEAKRLVLKRQLVNAYTRLISNLITIV